MQMNKVERINYPYIKYTPKEGIWGKWKYISKQPSPQR
jgi:hypothetical protein